MLLGDKIARIDCPRESFQTKDGDILVVSSDGLQFLTDDEIQTILEGSRDKSSMEIANTLLTAVNSLGDPDQDNISITVIKVTHAEAGRARASSDGQVQGRGVVNSMPTRVDETS